MAKKKETGLQRRIKKALIKECGGKWWKVHGSAFQEAGQPDLDGVVDHVSFKFEVKVPREGTPSELQLETLCEWRAVGSVACIVESPDQAVALVKAATDPSAKRRKGDKLYRWICRTLRAAHGEDMGYGRRPRSGKVRNPRRSSRWAVDQFKKHLGKVPKRKDPLVLGAP